MMKGTPATFTRKQEKEIVRLYEDGLTVTQVGEKFGVSYGAMLRRMKRIGLARRPAARKYTVDEHVFDAVDTEAKAYWLGFLYADGSPIKTGITLTLAVRDKEHVEKFRDFIGANTPVVVTDYQYPRATVRVSGIHLMERLHELGIVVHRVVPIKEIWEQIPPGLLHHWLRGFFDGDGCASKNPRIQLTLTSEVGKAVMELLSEKAGTNPKLALIKNIGTRKTVSLQYKGWNNAMKVVAFMYEDATIWMARKKDRIDAWPPLDYSDRTRRGYISRRKTPGFRKNQYQ